MTKNDFLAFYPQFEGFAPAVVLQTLIDRANERFSAFTAQDAEEARRLYTAHKLTLYAGTALSGAGFSMERLAEAGRVRQRVSGKKVGEVSVTYAAGASSSSAAADLAELGETEFGLQLLSLLRLYRRSVYVP